MKQIRMSVFETNSSSTHSITIVTEEEFLKWQSGKLLFDRDNEELVVPTEEIKYSETEDHCFTTYEDWLNKEENETFVEKYTTPKGEKIVAFGEYGYG